MLAVRQLFGKLAAGRGDSGDRRDYREERGDFTIALMIFSVVLITAATVAYTWPKSTSTRFTTQHVATQALRAGIAAVSDDAAAGREVADNKCYAREAAQSVIDDYRIHGVVMDIADPKIRATGDLNPARPDYSDPYRPDVCKALDPDEKTYLEGGAYPRCVPLSNGETYLILTINWHFTNPGSLVGRQVASRSSAQEPIPPALVSRLCDLTARSLP